MIVFSYVTWSKKLIIEVKNNKDLVNFIFNDSINIEFTHNYLTSLENSTKISKNIIKENELLVFDANSDVKINSNNLKTSFIDEDFNVKSRRSAANDVNYKTLQNS